VPRSHLPQNECRDAQKAYDERRDNVSLLPLRRLSSRNRERDQDEGEHGNAEDDANHVELPEERHGKTDETKALEGAFVFVERAQARGAAASKEKRHEEWGNADRIYDGPHADAPAPGRRSEDSVSDIARNPCIDLEYLLAEVIGGVGRAYNKRRRGDEGKEDAVSKGGSVSNKHFCDELDCSVADLPPWV
jgi:hypothetical protein